MGICWDVAGDPQQAEAGEVEPVQASEKQGKVISLKEQPRLERGKRRARRSGKQTGWSIAGTDELVHTLVGMPVYSRQLLQVGVSWPPSHSAPGWTPDCMLSPS